MIHAGIYNLFDEYFLSSGKSNKFAGYVNKGNHYKVSKILADIDTSQS